MAQAVVRDIDKNDPGRGLDLRKLGMWTFLGSEVFFFGALVVTHLSMRGVVAPSSSKTNFNVEQVRDLFGDNVLTSILAFILLTSSLTMVLALDGVKTNNQKRFRFWLGATIACGLVFIVLNPVSLTNIADNQSRCGKFREVGLDTVTLSDINIAVVVEIFSSVKNSVVVDVFRSSRVAASDVCLCDQHNTFRCPACIPSNTITASSGTITIDRRCGCSGSDHDV